MNARGKSRPLSHTECNDFPERLRFGRRLFFPLGLPTANPGPFHAQNVTISVNAFVKNIVTFKMRFDSFP